MEQPKSKQVVLLNDDETILTRVMAQELSDIGLESIRTSNFAEAMETYEKHHPNLIVSDLHMPNGGALELIDWIGEKFNEQPPAIIITGVIEDSVDRSKYPSVVEVLHKPLDLEHLLHLIAKNLQGSHSKSSA